jgi:predicted dehydrogenase
MARRRCHCDSLTTELCRIDGEICEIASKMSMTATQFESLKVGVIGSGQWARIAHLPAFTAITGVDVVAVAGIDPIEVSQVAVEFSVPNVYASGRELIADKRLDLVSIVTPDDCHFVDASAAIAAGLHVLCEKPLASTLHDAQILAKQARQSSFHTKMGFSLRYSPAMSRFRELVRNGAIGEVRHVQAFQQNGQFLDPAKPFHWKMDLGRTGGGAIVEYGVHTIDLLRWTVGDVARVSAISRTHTPERTLPGGGTRRVDVDDSTAVLFEFANGASGMLHAGWSTIGRPPGIELRVFGTRGALRCVLSDDLPRSEGLWIAGTDQQSFESIEIPATDVDEFPWWRRYTQLLIADFVAEIRGERLPSATFADGLAAQEILDTVLVAAQDRRWVDVPN